MNNLLAENEAHWKAAVRAAFPSGIPYSAYWIECDAIIRVLGHFTSTNLNHTMLPNGGGNNMSEVALSKEQDCIELRPSPGVAYVCRPSRLYFDYIPSALRESFFLLEVLPLSPSGVYEPAPSGREELLELPDGQYVSRGYLDEGFLGHDENGATIPIPSPHRLIVRQLAAGKFLLVAKASLWNATPGTYDGRHNQLSHSEIRGQIEIALAQ